MPAKKLEALHALTQHITLDEEVFVTIHELKEGRKKLRDVQPETLFERYLRGIDAVTQAVSELEKGS